VRIGIDTGPVVAGVIGRAKFIYDLWGDTVNTASRMESHAPPGTIQVTERTYERLRERYELVPRGTVEIKGKGQMTTYLLLSRRGNQASARLDVDAGVARTTALDNPTFGATRNPGERDHRIR
jgi:adenylate cyclase